tara:strand:+ start:428 stop:829 length:402 start_codon:yes stop_codon:yes gene_type:complete
MNTRQLREDDWETLQKWWSTWPKWPSIPKETLPENGTGGLIVEKEKTPIVAGFIYLTNSKIAFLEWIISNPNYRENDRNQAIKTLITKSEDLVRGLGCKVLFSFTQHKKLIETHKELGWLIDKEPSYELTKIL